MPCQSFNGFIKRDIEAAKRVFKENDEVNELGHQVNRQLTERIADRATNICERVAFIVTGILEEIGSSKY
jgi:phosphate transport system protein